MKKVTIIGFIASAIVFLAAMYLQFVIVPHWLSLSDSIDYESGYAEANFIKEQGLIFANEKKTNFAIGVLFCSFLPIILCCISIIKTKSKLAWLGIALSLVALLAGIANGSHMFS